jgi:hypothetical protein
MKAASLANDCFPDPPTPTNSALPRGDSRMRLILYYQTITNCSYILKKVPFSLLAEGKNGYKINMTSPWQMYVGN